MRLGIMQPYFFPNLAHFVLIASVDRWIVFDVTQYTPKSWMNRNRVLHPVTGWNYISVGLKRSSTSITTQQAVVDSLNKSHQSVLGKLSHYRSAAPFYKEVIGLVNDTFNSLISDSLVELNVSTLKHTCQYLDISFDYEVCSQLNLEFDSVPDAGEWAPIICQKLGANEYLNPIGGAELFSLDEFTRRGVELYFAEVAPFTYSTKHYEYQQHLSILDVLMWNSPLEIRNAICTSCNLTKASELHAQN
jgi:hypothetical protein